MPRILSTFTEWRKKRILKVKVQDFRTFQIEGKQNHNLDSFDDISREQIYSIKYLALLCLLWKVIKVIIDLVKLLSCSVSQHKFYIIIFIFCLGRGLTLECIHIITMCNNVEIRTSFMNSKRNVRNYVNAFIIDYGMDTKPLIGISIERSITEFQ